MTTQMTTQFIESLLKSKDFNKFKDFVKSLNNINKYLIEEKFEKNSLNILHICIGFEDFDFGLKCLKYLLSMSDIEVNTLAKISGTVMTGCHIAVIWNHYKALQTLIDSGCDLFLCDSYGQTIYEYAVEKEDQMSTELIDSAINRYLSLQNKTWIIESNDKSIEKSLNSVYKSEDKAKSEQKLSCVEETESDQTVIYFNEEDVIWKEFRNQSSDSCDSDNCSENTLISNISYEKSDSIKSCSSDKTEIYVYSDRDHNVVLIEERYEGCADESHSLQTLNQFDVISRSCVTQTNCDQPLDEMISGMNGTQIYNELLALGESPGPVVKSTKKYYAKRLLNLRKGMNISPSKKVLPLPEYSQELNRLIEDTFPFDEAEKLEQQFIEFFDKSNDKSKRNYFNYILIDPTLSQNIPSDAVSSKITINSSDRFDTKLFSRFVKSIFYVGKGQGNRVYEHFYEAIKTFDPKKINKKVETIQRIWSKDKGVVSLHCFCDIGSNEALAREAMVIDALVLNNLANQKSGQNVRQLKWNGRKKRIFGSFLLYKSFKIYLLTGERQIRRPTIQT